MNIQPIMYTYTGSRLNPLELREEDIDLLDIAHALALCNRFAGHTKEPISVAQHCVYAAELLRGTDYELQALLHDASEGYLGDVTKWLKSSPEMTAYRQAEDRLQRLIYRRFGCQEDDAPEVKDADRLLVRYEGYMGFGSHWNVLSMQPGNQEVHADYPLLTQRDKWRVGSLFGGWRCWDWREAERMFIGRYCMLTGDTLCI